MNGENWVLLAVTAAVFTYKMTALGVRHQQAKRRDQAKQATS